MAGSRIVVELAGEEASLQAAVDKAADALGSLSDVITKTAKASIASGDQIIASNKEVGSSFADVAGVARDAAGGVGDATAKAAGSVDAGSAKIVAANDDVIDSFAKVADSAGATADAAVLASDRTATAAARMATVSTDSAAKSDVAFGASGSALTKFGKVATEAVLGVAAGSIYAAAKFQQATVQYVTQAGVGVDASHKLAAGILNMAGQVGQVPDELAGGMYHIVSSMNNMIPPAHRVSTELGILRVAAEGAAVGGSNMTDTTYVLSAAMNALGQKTIPGAKQSMAELNAIVGAGDMHLQDLLGAMSTGILPVSKTFGISLQSMGAALDVLADKGVPAQQAATKLRMAITEMGAPTKMATGILETLGLTSKEALSSSQNMTTLLQSAGVSTTQIAADLRQPDGILVALEDLKKHLEDTGLSATGTAAVISRAFGGIRGATVIETLYQSLDKLHGKYIQIGADSSKFGQDWKDTQQTLTFQLHQVEGEVIALGVDIGDKLMPYVVDGIDDLKEFAHWLEQNKIIAGALAGVLAAGTGVAVASYATAKVANIGTMLTQMMRTVGIGGSTGTAAAATGVGGTSVLGAAGGIGGIRGVGLAGTAANPIVVVIESGQYAGLGGLSAAGSAEAASSTDIVAAKAAAAGSTAEVAASAGAGEIAPAVEETAMAGMGATFLTGLKGLMGGLLKGGLIAGVGMLGSKVAGSVIGGTTGKDVSTIGTDTAIGAAAGTVIPALGTLTGALAGAMFGTLTTLAKSPTLGETMVNGLNESIKKAAGKNGIGLAAGGAAAASKVLTTAQNQTSTSILPVDAMNPALIAKDNATLKAAYLKAGGDAGRALIQGFADANVAPSLSKMELESKAVLDKLPEDARGSAEQAMAAMATTLAKDGRLPKGALHDFLESMVKDFPSLGKSAGDAGVSSVKAMQDNLKFDKVEASVQADMTTISETFGDLPQGVKLNAGNASTLFEQYLKTDHDNAKQYTGQLKTDALANYKTLHDEAINYFRDLTANVKSEGDAQAGSIASNTGQSVASVKSGFGQMASIVNQQIGAGLTSTTAGMSKINSEIVKELSKLTTGAPTVKASSTGGSAINFHGLAMGGLIQLGNPGERGHDSIPMIAGGVPIVAARGEQVAVFTHQQQAAANAALGPVGGLAGIFSNRTPHYMAAGGLVTPTVAGGGQIAGIGQSAVNDVMSVVASMLAGAGAGPGGSPTNTAQLMPYITRLAGAHGWGASDIQAWLSVINRESGGNMRAMNAKSGAAGIAQFIQGYSEYAAYGGSAGSIAGQLTAMANYIAERYGTPVGAWASEESRGWYYGGGLVMDKLKEPGPATSKPSVPTSKPGTKGSSGVKALSPSALQTLSESGKQIASLYDDIQNQGTTFTAQQTRFGDDEAQQVYLNSDGSLDAAGVALKQADDQTLIGIETQILNDYTALLPLVTKALSTAGATQTRGKDTEAANKAKIRANQLSMAQLRAQILDEEKPTVNVVQAIEDQIAKAKNKWAPIVNAARTSNISGTSALVASEEAASLQGLNVSLLQAKMAQQAHATKVKLDTYSMRQQISTMTLADSKLTAKDASIAAALTGVVGSSAGADATVSVLQTIAPTLGTVTYSGGTFTGINTSNQGGAYNAQSEIESLTNDQAAAANVSTSDSVNQNLLDLLEENTTSLSEALATSQAQMSVLTGFVPELAAGPYARGGFVIDQFVRGLPHFDTGGPVLRDGPAVLHEGEHVVPAGGSLVSQGAPPIHLHNHIHGNASAFIDAVDARVSHPQNVMKISAQIGRRTGALRSAPGGYR